MSILSSLARRAPRRPSARRDRGATACRRASLDGAAASAVVAAHASEPLPDGALVPSLTAPNVARSRPPCSRRSTRVLERLGPAAARRRSSLPDVVAEGVARAVRAGAGARRRTSISWCAGRSARARRSRSRRRRSATCPASRADDGQEFVVTLARRDVVAGVRGAVRRRRARTPGSSIWRRFNVDQRGAGRAAGAPAGDWLLVQRRRRLRVDRDPARRAT